jgi:hypothetical protein
MIAGTTQLIESKVPFGESIYCWLEAEHSHTFEELVRFSHPFERVYMAWQEVRRGRNPFFENGTGFEGYFIGTCATSDQALVHILALGHEMLDSIARFHHSEPHFHSVLMKTLFEESDDIRAMREWSTELGAVLSQLRCNLLRNSQAAAFQLETYTLLSLLPPVEYWQADQTVWQRYHLTCERQFSNKISVDYSTFSPADQEAWLVVKNVGKFGHPLVRQLLALTETYSGCEVGASR